jgi:DNA-binding MarR family transcriptional regulator
MSGKQGVGPSLAEPVGGTSVAEPAGPSLAEPAGVTSVAEPAGVAARLLVAIGRINRSLRRRAPTWLGPAAASTLDSLLREGPMRPSDLAATEGVRPPTMTRVVAGLEQDGYVARVPDPSDGRACLVQVTEAGRELIRSAGEQRSGLLSERIGAMAAEDRRLLAEAVDLLDRLSDPRCG